MDAVIPYPASTSLNVGITYDSYDRAHVVSDGTGSITNSFDDLGEVYQSVRAYTGLSNQTLTYSRYPDGSRSAMTTPGGNFSYTYDGDGRYSSMISPAGTSHASYLDNGWQQTRTLPNGIVTTYTLDAVGALSGLSSAISGNTVSAFSSFAYDGVFNLTGFSASYGTGGTLPNGSRSFGYDSKDRLTSSSIPTSNTTTVNSTFGFDSAGNRTSVNSTTIPFNSDNQCSSSGYSFDGNGNPTAYNGTSLSFDPENRVTAIGSVNTATYRADGLRAKKTSGSTTTYYLYDGGEPVVELNSSGTVTALNVFAPDGLVARTAGSATTEYVFDQQGNVADRTHGSGSVQSVTQYDAWGNEQAITGTPTDPFGFNAQSGYYLDRDTGLYLCQHRFYDPANDRWLNRDPIAYGGGTNLYGYCAGGPVNAADAEGLIDPLRIILGMQNLPGPPFQVPGGGPGNYWVPGGDRGGRQIWKPAEPVPSRGGGQPEASWDDAPQKSGRSPSQPHWDRINGDGTRDRISPDGKYLTPEEAHGRRMPSPSPSPWIPWILGGDWPTIPLFIPLDPRIWGFRGPCGDNMPA